MNWLFQLHNTQPVAYAIGAIALVCTAGMALGSVKVRSIGLGTAGVLFPGLIAGHFGKPVDHAILDFVKEFGLIFFLFTIGLQLGPDLLAALKKEGLRFNALAGGVVLLGTATPSASAGCSSWISRPVWRRRRACDYSVAPGCRGT